MDQPPPSTRLYRLATAHYGSHALYAAAKLGVAEHLLDGPKDAGALAAATQTDADSLRRVLRLLVAEGVFVEDTDGRFSNTDVGDALARGFTDAAQLFAGPSVWPAWGDLLETVRTGEPAFHRVFGKGPFEYFAERPDEAASFDRAMASFTAAASAAVASSYDFTDVERVIDIGGGEGALLVEVLRANPHLRAAVFDLPQTRARAEAQIAEAELSERYRFVGGDFFESVPDGFDAYLIKHVIHDWDDAKATAILRSIRAAISDGDGRLLLVEGLYPAHIDTSGPCLGATRNDCNMMVVAGGRQRSEAELRALYEAAGFELAAVVRTPMGLAIVEGRPA